MPGMVPGSSRGNPSWTMVEVERGRAPGADPVVSIPPPPAGRTENNESNESNEEGQNRTT